MSKTKLTVLAAFALISAVAWTAQAQDQPSQSQPTPTPPPKSDEARRANDAVDNAQLSRAAAMKRPEQQKNAHDRSSVFSAGNAPPSSPVFASQPEKGMTLGFDFYRDPLDAKKPMQSPEEIMKQDMADKPKVMAAQQKLLLRVEDSRAAG